MTSGWLPEQPAAKHFLIRAGPDGRVRAELLKVLAVSLVLVIGDGGGEICDW